MSGKTVPNRDVDAYIAQLKSPIREVVRALRQLVQETAPDAEEAIKWGMPCYERNGLLFGICPTNAYVRLQFFRGAALPDPAHLLEGTGKGMRHMKVRNTADIKVDELRALVREAVWLNAKG